MIYAIYNILFSHTKHSLLDKRSMAVLDETCKFSGPESLEASLNFAKRELNRIKLGLVP